MEILAMTFTEKLRRLTEERVKTKICRRAGLPAHAIADYLCKKQIPRGDNALKLARAMGVSLVWLLDDSQEWPPVWEGADDCAAGSAA